MTKKHFIIEQGAQTPNVAFYADSYYMNVSYSANVLSFGNFFQINKDFANTIFSVSDAIGNPIIEADSTLTVYLAPLSGNVVIGGESLPSDSSEVFLVEGIANVNAEVRVSTSNKSPLDRLTIGGHIRPTTDAIFNLGASSNQWSNIYVETVTLGDWTIYENSGNLYFATSGTSQMKLMSNGQLEIAGTLVESASIV